MLQGLDPTALPSALAFDPIAPASSLAAPSSAPFGPAFPVAAVSSVSVWRLCGVCSGLPAAFLE